MIAYRLLPGLALVLTCGAEARMSGAVRDAAHAACESVRADRQHHRAARLTGHDTVQHDLERAKAGTATPTADPTTW